MSKRTAYKTPRCTLGFCSIDKPDTKFIDPKDEHDEGAYKAMLLMPKDAPETQEFMAKIQAEFDEFLQQEKAKTGKTPKLSPDAIPWSEETDKDSDELTGNIIFRTKLKRKVYIKSKDESYQQTVKVFDSSGTPMIPVPSVGPGSRVRVAGELNPWVTAGKAGISLWLHAVQVLELKEWSRKKATAGDYGFEADSEHGGESFDDAAKGQF